MASPDVQRLIDEFRQQPSRPDATVEDLRTGFATLARARFSLPEGVSYRPVEAGSVPAEWATPEGAEAGSAILYLHGGGFCMGSIDTHRALAARLAQAAETPTLQVGYRLAPEHPFPAALDDCVAAYRWLLKSGVPAAKIVLAGDSAGGGLVLSTLLALRDGGDPLPAGAICLSPVTDLAKEGESMRTQAETDPMVKPVSSKANGDRYLGGADAKTPLASPLYADLHGLPPTLILVGTMEIMLDDSVRWAARATAAGSPVELQVWDGLFHVWPLFAAELPEGREAIERMGAFVSSHIAA